MVTGESPKILFDIIMTRFEEDYNPTIIYDASCLEKEVGMDREPEWFSELRIVSDPFMLLIIQAVLKHSTATLNLIYLK